MPRFTLTQLLCAISLFAILLAFTQCGGCGRRLSSVGCVSFSADGSRLAVARYDARDAEVPFKIYIADVARTISILDTIDGRTRQILRQDVQWGNQGPAFYLFGHRSIAFDCHRPDSLLVADLGGGALHVISIDSTLPSRSLGPLLHRVRDVVPLTGNLIAACGDRQLTVVDVAANKSLLHMPGGVSLSYGSVAFSPGESLIATAGLGQVEVGDVQTGRTSAVIQDSQTFFSGIAFLPDGSLLVCSDGALRCVDLSGTTTATLSSNGSYTGCDVSTKSQLIAAVCDGQVELFDLSSKAKVNQLNHPARCVSFSPDGTKLAIGCVGGTVALVDARTGHTIWHVTPAGHYRWPWTAPTAMLIAWSIGCWCLYRRTRSAA